MILEYKGIFRDDTKANLIKEKLMEKNVTS
jgi:hypothetical protein